MSPTDFTVEAIGSDVNIIIKAGNLGWSITSDKDWVSASNKFGSGDETVKLTIIKNETGDKRTAKVVVKPTFELKPVNITITQN